MNRFCSQHKENLDRECPECRRANIKRFLELVSHEETDTMAKIKRRIKWRWLIRIKNRIHLWWLNIVD